MMQIDLSTIKPAPMNAPRILLHGLDGDGKTTMACGAPDAIMLDLEGGRVRNTPKLHRHGSWTGLSKRATPSQTSYRGHSTHETYL